MGLSKRLRMTANDAESWGVAPEDRRATITIERPGREWFAWGRTYSIIIDGRPVEQLAAGQAADVPVVAGDHEVFAKLDWIKTETVRLRLEKGERAELVCGTNKTPWSPMWLWAMTGLPGIGLALSTVVASKFVQGEPVPEGILWAMFLAGLGLLAISTPILFWLLIVPKPGMMIRLEKKTTAEPKDVMGRTVMGPSA